MGLDDWVGYIEVLIERMQSYRAILEPQGAYRAGPSDRQTI